MAKPWISDWRPDDPAFWEAGGKNVARRNLIFSIFAEHLGFTIWTVWSIVAVQLGSYRFSTDQLFWMVSLPNLIGSALRIPYTFGPAKFGGRNFTVVSAALLLIPAVLLAFAVSDPATPYWVFLVIAATAGLGGGNFASSMANITYFYPQHKQGSALGLNAAGGNIGVSSVQLVMPLVIGAFGLAAAGLFWIPFILAAAIGAYFFMDNLSTAKASPREQLRIAGRAQTWIMSVLYIGTFGSFIGYSTAFPLLIKSQFPEYASLVWLAFLGPLLGSLVRPAGGWLSDRLGGARVTLLNFGAMAGAAALVWQGLAQHSFVLFFGAYMLLVGTTGVGNGSTYRMIPAIFRAKATAGLAPGTPAHEAAVAVGKRDASAAIGIISAVGAFGGFFINRGFGSSLAATGGAGAALAAFAAFYALCALVTWACYLRTTGPVPSLAAARV
ncbi:NNP family nitrate/nitrite transporter-like MFS transporter [Streptosporangium becharense]|uniref:NNP family nitrate/nitrite transporter-like MFS transporter n=1 Tax=Streptosporangium becharense TaxID=1816182 RepID=A0A7W9IC93_9ACTN|nr:MFS transporter [Streptosporangium becharense]MBB2913784.1 NNP family nitrate/nitrite transporter-like MFS transporter [Streptosporangium becharense]MBB5817865.1 NNP family nitrate/nitrite transporter-like MFS transporter [Streptosporangium becharense]